MRKLLFTIALGLTTLATAPAMAQTSYIQPFGNGYSVNTPGQSPTYVQRFGNGYSYTPPRPSFGPPLTVPFVPAPAGGYNR